MSKSERNATTARTLFLRVASAEESDSPAGEKPADIDLSSHDAAWDAEAGIAEHTLATRHSARIAA